MLSLPQVADGGLFSMSTRLRSLRLLLFLPIVQFRDMIPDDKTSEVIHFEQMVVSRVKHKFVLQTLDE